MLLVQRNIRITPKYAVRFMVMRLPKITFFAEKISNVYQLGKMSYDRQ